jgi:hypothetical protein
VYTTKLQQSEVKMIEHKASMAVLGKKVAATGAIFRFVFVLLKEIFRFFLADTSMRTHT